MNRSMGILCLVLGPIVVLAILTTVAYQHWSEQNRIVGSWCAPYVLMGDPSNAGRLVFCSGGALTDTSGFLGAPAARGHWQMKGDALYITWTMPQERTPALDPYLTPLPPDPTSYTQRWRIEFSPDGRHLSVLDGPYVGMVLDRAP